MADSPLEIQTFTLNNGVKMPGIGMGCWLGPEGGLDVIEDLCRNALKCGYRHLDTAAGYNNEALVGKAVRESGIPRSEIFVTTKLPNTHHHRVREAFEESLAKLNIDYVDLYLMHWPQASIDGRSLSPEESPTIIETWKDMEKLLDTGKVKAIGVSNFSVKLLELLLPHCSVVPVTNQVEMHPCLPLFKLKRYCDEKQILLTAYSPLGRGNALFFDDPDFVKIVNDHAVTPAQIAISWTLQRGTVPIPKSANVDRMKANITPVELTAEDMQVIDNLHKKPGMHRSLLEYHSVTPGQVLGWTYEQLGWPMSAGGIIEKQSAS